MYYVNPLIKCICKHIHIHFTHIQVYIYFYMKDLKRCSMQLQSSLPSCLPSPYISNGLKIQVNFKPGTSQLKSTNVRVEVSLLKKIHGIYVLSDYVVLVLRQPQSSCKIDGQQEAGVQHRKLSSVLCDDPEEWDVEGRCSKGRDIHILMADSYCYIEETNTTLEINYIPIKKKESHSHNSQSLEFSIVLDTWTN